MGEARDHEMSDEEIWALLVSQLKQAAKRTREKVEESIDTKPIIAKPLIVLAFIRLHMDIEKIMRGEIIYPLK